MQSSKDSLQRLQWAHTAELGGKQASPRLSIIETNSEHLMNIKDLRCFTEANGLAIILKIIDVLIRYSLIRSILPKICICFLHCILDSACI